MKKMNLKEQVDTKTYECMVKLSKKYAQSLLRSGYPSNTHVYELNQDFLERKLPKPEALFLARAKRFFKELPFIEGLIFLNDYLEKDKNYQFWWLVYGNEDFIRKERKKLECKIKSKIKYLLAG